MQVGRDRYRCVQRRQHVDKAEQLDLDLVVGHRQLHHPLVPPPRFVERGNIIPQRLEQLPPDFLGPDLDRCELRGGQGIGEWVGHGFSPRQRHTRTPDSIPPPSSGYNGRSPRKVAVSVQVLSHSPTDSQVHGGPGSWTLIPGSRLAGTFRRSLFETLLRLGCDSDDWNLCEAPDPSIRHAVDAWTDVVVEALPGGGEPGARHAARRRRLRSEAMFQEVR